VFVCPARFMTRAGELGCKRCIRSTGPTDNVFPINLAAEYRVSCVQPDALFFTVDANEMMMR
jgi:hypothetical protein